MERSAPILDAERERALLENVVERGKAHQLGPEITRAFFAAQMEAAKIVQEHDFERWRAAKQPPFHDVPDLSTLRQQIDTRNGELLAALHDARPFLEQKDGEKLLEERAADRFADVPAAAREAALRPLRMPWDRAGQAPASP